MVTHLKGRMCGKLEERPPEGQRASPAILKRSALYDPSYGAYVGAPLVSQDLCRLASKCDSHRGY